MVVAAIISSASPATARDGAAMLSSAWVACSVSGRRRRRIYANGITTAPSSMATRQPHSPKAACGSRLPSTVPTMPTQSTAKYWVAFCKLT